MAKGIYAPIPRDAREALVVLAAREFRRPQEQAAKLLVEGLKRLGALPPESTDLTEANDRAPVGAA